MLGVRGVRALRRDPLLRVAVTGLRRRAVRVLRVAHELFLTSGRETGTVGAEEVSRGTSGGTPRRPRGSAA
ncbi:hypothetical protein GCM10023079_07750 [Streptomyces chitinivorans]